jgi:hypothetical protein
MDLWLIQVMGGFLASLCHQKWLQPWEILISSHHAGPLASTSASPHQKWLQPWEMLISTHHAGPLASSLPSKPPQEDARSWEFLSGIGAYVISLYSNIFEICRGLL